MRRDRGWRLRTCEVPNDGVFRMDRPRLSMIELVIPNGLFRDGIISGPSCLLIFTYECPNISADGDLNWVPTLEQTAKHALKNEFGTSCLNIPCCWDESPRISLLSTYHFKRQQCLVHLSRYLRPRTFLQGRPRGVCQDFCPGTRSLRTILLFLSFLGHIYQDIPISLFILA